jgi:tight adherence protein B
MQPLLYLLVFLAAATAVEGLVRLLADRQGGRARLLARLRRHAGPRPGEHAASGRSIVRDRGRARLRDRIPGHGAVEILLYRAAIGLSVEGFLLLGAALAAAGAALGVALAMGTAASILLGAAGALLPTGGAWLRRRQRSRRFDRQLPEAIELLVRALRAGHSIRVGLHLIGEELPDPVGSEFALVAEEVSFGMDLGDAMRGLSRRVDHPDLPFFVNAVLIQRETGGNLTEILQSLARVIRQRHQFHGRVRALLAQIRLTANVLAVVPVVLVGAISLVNPTYVAPLFDTPLGRTLAWTAAGLVAFGWLLCRRLGAVRY